MLQADTTWFCILVLKITMHFIYNSAVADLSRNAPAYRLQEKIE